MWFSLSYIFVFVFSYIAAIKLDLLNLLILICKVADCDLGLILKNIFLQTQDEAIALGSRSVPEDLGWFS